MESSPDISSGNEYSPLKRELITEHTEHTEPRRPFFSVISVISVVDVFCDSFRCLTFPTGRSLSIGGPDARYTRGVGLSGPVALHVHRSGGGRQRRASAAGASLNHDCPI
jgi:hypothetical protein